MSTTMKAIRTTSAQTIQVDEIAIPTPNQGEILIKVVAIAQNPTDWKSVGAGNKAELLVGSDFAGIVDKLGDGVFNLAVGTRVAGFVHGARSTDRGSFAQYIVTEASLVWKIPERTTFEDAAAIGGIAGETAIFSLFNKSGLGLSQNPFNKGESFIPILVWGGASSVGQYAIQLAHASGYKVVATASPKNFDLIKKLGAAEVFDYKDSTTPQKIKEKYPTIENALDCISLEETSKAVQESLHSGQINYLLPTPIPSPNSKIQQKWILIYTTRGIAFQFGTIPFDPNLEDKQFAIDWLPKLSELVENGSLKANQTKNLGGLEQVQEGFQLMKDGKVSAEKLVYTVAH